MWADCCASAFNFLASRQNIVQPVLLGSTVNSSSKLAELRTTQTYERKV